MLADAVSAAAGSGPSISLSAVTGNVSPRGAAELQDKPITTTPSAASKAAQAEKRVLDQKAPVEKSGISPSTGASGSRVRDQKSSGERKKTFSFLDESSSSDDDSISAYAKVIEEEIEKKKRTDNTTTTTIVPKLPT